MKEDNQAIDLLIETSWEVCNKVGGIYTVFSTKAKNLHKLYGDKLIFIGPDVWSEENPSPFFIENKNLLKGWQNKAIFPQGVSVRVGRWDVPGRPLALLVKFEGMYECRNEFYAKMWDLYGVDSLHAYGDYDEACAFSHAAGIVIEQLYLYYNGREKNIIAHFDEWTTGMGLLYVKAQLPTVATIFTTHATSIGRSICGNGKQLYAYLNGYNGDQMASELNMQSKHSLEKAAATQADCFTTVSEITAIECEQLLDKKPDIVTPNGFEPNFVPAKSKFAQARKAARETLLKVGNALTGNNFADDTFIVCTSGRCEYRNKGIDLFLDSMRRLVELNPCRKILAYVMVPAWSDKPRQDLLDRLSNNLDSSSPLVDPIITHSLFNTNQDPILNRIKSIGFGYNNQWPIDVIYVPCYLNGDDGVFNASYYQLLIGMDATVFPSYYEPWGYTPLESVAFGIPTITTSLSGFGRWVEDTSTACFEESGVVVSQRNDSNYSEVVENIANSIKFLTCSDQTTLKEISEKAFATADKANWKEFVEYYLKAFNIAFNHEQQRLQKHL